VVTTQPDTPAEEEKLIVRSENLFYVFLFFSAVPPNTMGSCSVAHASGADVQITFLAAAWALFGCILHNYIFEMIDDLVFSIVPFAQLFQNFACLRVLFRQDFNVTVGGGTSALHS
jgi:hypothetical protein